MLRRVATLRYWTRTCCLVTSFTMGSFSFSSSMPEVITRLCFLWPTYPVNIKVKNADSHMYILMIQWFNKWIILVNVLYIEICHIFLLPKKIIFMWPKSMLPSVDLWESSVSASLKINRRIQLLRIMHSKQMEINLTSSTLHIYVQKSFSCVQYKVVIHMYFSLLYKYM